MEEEEEEEERRSLYSELVSNRDLTEPLVLGILMADSCSLLLLRPTLHGSPLLETLPASDYFVYFSADGRYR